MAIVLQEETEDHILAVTVWAIGQIGKHTPEHAKAVAAANILSKLLKVYLRILSYSLPELALLKLAEVLNFS